MCGGEALSHSLGKQLLAASGGFWNVYGPTEATIWSLIERVQTIDERQHSSIVPIGKPIANTRAYVFDRNDQLTPIGVIGELYLAGDGLAKEYLNRPELTASSFIASPLPQEV